MKSNAAKSPLESSVFDFGLEEFLKRLSHELRSPLSNLSGFRKELERDFVDLQESLMNLPMEADVRGQLDDIPSEITQIGRAADKIDALLTESLHYLRLNSIQPRVTSFGIGVAIRMAQQKFLNQMQDAGAKLVLRGDFPTVVGDMMLTASVFEILLDNCLRHRVAQLGLEVVVHAKVLGSCVRVMVEDNGPGISLANSDDLFKPFSPGTSARRGLGLGLATARQIMRLQGGMLTQGRAATGTLMIVEFPYSEPKGTT